MSSALHLPMSGDENTNSNHLNDMTESDKDITSQN
jgi:hypothetical protein